jgi:glycine cleavage system H protein
MAFKHDMQARYARTDEWVRLDGDVAVVGISDYAQDALSDVVYVELPEVGASFAQGEQIASVESVKAASEIYAPIGGRVIAVNTELEDRPELVNEDPFGIAWLLKLKPVDTSEMANLMDAAGYEAYCATREH